MVELYDEKRSLLVLSKPSVLTNCRPMMNSRRSVPPHRRTDSSSRTAVLEPPALFFFYLSLCQRKGWSWWTTTSSKLVLQLKKTEMAEKTDDLLFYSDNFSDNLHTTEDWKFFIPGLTPRFRVCCWRGPPRTANWVLMTQMCNFLCFYILRF